MPRSVERTLTVTQDLVEALQAHAFGPKPLLEIFAPNWNDAAIVPCRRDLQGWIVGDRGEGMEFRFILLGPARAHKHATSISRGGRASKWRQSVRIYI